ncbi:hypothetical protein TSMEX_006447 [Taenia solium]|eukprot:TsM_001003900 transcript=TsM_001003900 gene=TsM_001003900
MRAVCTAGSEYAAFARAGYFAITTTTTSSSLSSSSSPCLDPPPTSPDHHVLSLLQHWRPLPPMLTSGEQTAIEIAAFLLICIIIAVCIFTWRNRRSEKARRMSHYNGILPSHHQEAQMELML